MRSQMRLIVFRVAITFHPFQLLKAILDPLQGGLARMTVQTQSSREGLELLC